MEFSEAARDYERRAEPLELSDDGRRSLRLHTKILP